MMYSIAKLSLVKLWNFRTFPIMLQVASLQSRIIHVGDVYLTFHSCPRLYDVFDHFTWILCERYVDPLRTEFTLFSGFASECT